VAGTIHGGASGGTHLIFIGTPAEHRQLITTVKAEPVVVMDFYLMIKNAVPVRAAVKTPSRKTTKEKTAPHRDKAGSGLTALLDCKVASLSTI
jgi:hypothetical protein